MVGGVAVLVLGVLSPVIHIHISKATHEQLWRKKRQVDNVDYGLFLLFLYFSTSGQLKTHLKFILIKDLDQILWYQLKESLKHKNVR